jgi:hypothetical protein
MIEHPCDRVTRRLGQRAKCRAGLIVAHSLDRVMQALVSQG